LKTVWSGLGLLYNTRLFVIIEEQRLSDLDTKRSQALMISRTCDNRLTIYDLVSEGLSHQVTH
jgi:hypothetical protein